MWLTFPNPVHQQHNASSFSSVGTGTSLVLSLQIHLPTHHGQTVLNAALQIMFNCPMIWCDPWQKIRNVSSAFSGSNITVDGDCSHEIKRGLLLGKNVMTNLDSILKSRDITSLTKVHPVKAMIFPVVMYGCKSRAIKKAEGWRTDASELWCWRRLLRVSWTATRSN